MQYNYGIDSYQSGNDYRYIALRASALKDDPAGSLNGWLAAHGYFVETDAATVRIVQNPPILHVEGRKSPVLVLVGAATSPANFSPFKRRRESRVLLFIAEVVGASRGDHVQVSASLNICHRHYPAGPKGHYGPRRLQVHGRRHERGRRQRALPLCLHPRVRCRKVGNLSARLLALRDHFRFSFSHLRPSAEPQRSRELTITVLTLERESGPSSTTPRCSEPRRWTSPTRVAWYAPHQPPVHWSSWATAFSGRARSEEHARSTPTIETFMCCCWLLALD